MHWIDWLIMILPFLTVLGLAVYSGKFVRGVADFLAAGRVAGRYVIAVGDVADVTMEDGRVLSVSVSKDEAKAREERNKSRLAAFFAKGKKP